MEELVVYIKEAVDRKQENVRRRRRRDALRLQLVKVLELIAEYGTFGVSPCVLDRDTQSLHPTFIEYMDGARLYLEGEPDKNSNAVKEITLHFGNFITKMIKSFSCEFLFVVYLITVCFSFLLFSGNLSDVAEARSKTKHFHVIFHLVW